MNRVYLALSFVIVVLSVALLTTAILSQPRPQSLSVESPSPSSTPQLTPIDTASPTPTQSQLPTPSVTPSQPSSSPAATSVTNDQLSISNIQFESQNVVVFTVINLGTRDVTINKVYCNGIDQSVTIVYLTGSSTIQANAQATLSFNYNWMPGNNYQIAVVTENGNTFSYSTVASS